MDEYLNILPLDTVKTYLRVDQSFTQDDELIKMFIVAALKQLEEQTLHIFYKREITKIVVGSAVRVYEYPLHSFPDESTILEKIKKNGYTLVYLNDDSETLLIEAGYENPEDVPEPLKQVSLEMIDINYHGSKEGNVQDLELSPFAKTMLSNYKRFLI